MGYEPNVLWWRAGDSTVYFNIKLCTSTQLPIFAGKLDCQNLPSVRRYTRRTLDFLRTLPLHRPRPLRHQTTWTNYLRGLRGPARFRVSPTSSSAHPDHLQHEVWQTRARSRCTHRSRARSRGNHNSCRRSPSGRRSRRRSFDRLACCTRHRV